MRNITDLKKTKGTPIHRLCEEIMMPRATYYRQQQPQEPANTMTHQSPKNALSHLEKQTVLDLLHSERFVDKTPYEMYHALIDDDQYYCSPRTMYRLLSAQNEIFDRRRPRNHRNAVKPELLATGPNQVWSWDITKFFSTQKLKYFYLYVIIDIYSRYVVGWLVADCESQDIAKKLIQESTLKQGIQRDQLTLHSDNGASMKSHSVAALLEHLGITKTHNRPHTSDDNPFSEAQFKTVKYHPEFPGRFETIEEAILFCQKFFIWYNQSHYHSGLAWLTPESVHYGQGSQILENRHQVLMSAFQKFPARFRRQGPELKRLPQAVYINPPQPNIFKNLQSEAAMI